MMQNATAPHFADPDVGVYIPGIQPFNVPTRLCNLQPFPQVAAQVLGMSADTVSLQQIAQFVEVDQAFSADILTLANSSLFAFPSQVQSIQHAIVLLGLETVKTLALTVAMRTYFRVGGEPPVLRQCWRHNIASAVIAAALARFTRAPREESYTAGLMHDIGRLGLMKSYAREYAPVLNYKYADVKELMEAEQKAVGITHAEAGAWLTKTWAFPQQLRVIAAHHHNPHPANAIEQTISIACQLASSIGFAAANIPKRPGRKDLMRRFPALNIAGESFITSIAQTVEEKIRAFEG